MKQFLKLIAASAIGSFLAACFALFFLLALVSGLAQMGFSAGPPVDVKQSSVLRIDVAGEIVEKTSRFNWAHFSPMAPRQVQNLGLLELQETLEAARDDARIKGLYLRFYPFQAGWATLRSFKTAVADFKAAGKFVVAYGEGFSEKAFYLASEADEIHLYPTGYFELDGLSATSAFVKGTLDKLDVEPVIFRVGNFKAAIEPLTRQSMSEENRQQTLQYVSDIWSQYLDGIKVPEGVTREQVNEWASQLAVVTAKEALEKQLVSSLTSEYEVLRALRKRSGLEEKEDEPLPNMVMYSEYRRARQQEVASDPESDKRVALVYITGEIMDGESYDERTGSDTIIDALRAIQKDKKVKALVLRVNSPGGSALASDVIWRELSKMKETMPVLATMGDVAASGGYYVAAGAREIWAEPNTLTGSIGVFGVMFNAKQFFDQKLGVTFDRVITHPYADSGSFTREISDYEKNRIMDTVRQTYSQFLEVVQESREIESREEAEALAGGRIWSGTRAKELGLVDELGGMPQALERAAELAKLGKDYDVYVYPEEPGPFQWLMQDLGVQIRSWVLPEGMEAVSEMARWWRGIRLPTGPSVYARQLFDLEAE